MELVMCRSCGEFVSAIEVDGELVIEYDECPECGGKESKNNKTGQIIRLDY